MMKEEISRLIQREVKAIQSIPVEETMGRAVALIHECVHEKGGKVVFSGMGKAGQVGHNIATTLSSTGTPSIFLHASEAQHGDLGILQPNDILFLISNSGKTSEILKLVELAKALYTAMPVVCLTGHPENSLGLLADIAISTGEPDEICPLGLTPTTSTTVMTVIGDILVVMLMKKIGFTTEDYAKRHHSGYLGDKSRAHE